MAFPLFASLAAAAMSFEIPDEQRTRLFVAAIVLTGLALGSAGLAWWLGRKQVAEAEAAATAAREAAIEESTEYVLALTGAITPLSACLADMATSSGRVGRAEALGSLTQAAVGSLAQTGPGTCHAAVYILQTDPAPALVLYKYAGPGRRPRQAFTVETNDGLDALHMVLEKGRIDAPDARNDPSVKPQGDYASVMAVHLGAGGRLYGMLTLDADEIGALGETELELMLSVANLLAAGFAMSNRPGVLPEDLRRALSDHGRTMWEEGGRP